MLLFCTFIHCLFVCFSVLHFQKTVLVQADVFVCFVSTTHWQKPFIFFFLFCIILLCIFHEQQQRKKNQYNYYALVFLFLLRLYSYATADCVHTMRMVILKTFLHTNAHLRDKLDINNANKSRLHFLNRQFTKKTQKNYCAF